MNNDGTDPRQRVDELAGLSPAERQARVTDLADLLGAERASVRYRTVALVRELVQGYPDTAADLVDTLVTRLDDDSPGVQHRAAYALGDLGRESPAAIAGAITPLCRLLEHPDPDVRAGAAYALGAMATAPAAGADDATAALFAALDADAPAARQHAAFVLATVAGENPRALNTRVRPIIRGIADTDPSVRRNLLHALEDLDSAFPDRVEAARTEAAETLAGIDPREATDVDTAALRGMATDDSVPDDLRQAARAALPDGPGSTDAGTEPDSHPAKTPTSEEPTDQSETTTAETRTCPECGEQFGPDATFCTVCGTPLE